MNKPYKRDNRSPVPKNDSVSKVMRGNKSKNTVPELLLRKFLWINGFKGYRLHRKNLVGKPDLSFNKFRVAIFVNGCFWHRCPVCSKPLPKNNSEFWATKFNKNILRDEKKINELKMDGWQSIVIWECEVSPIFKKETQKKIINILRTYNEVKKREPKL